MARIRNRQETGNEAGSQKIIWQIALYIRLSKEDGNDESMSVTNQKKILMEYLEHYFVGQFVVKDYFIDDGRTGTDDQRPGFQRMLREMEEGRINCILCKNLSRMFRNYADQGYFLEKIFPVNKVRFIAISSPQVDSFLRPETMLGLEIPINGLMNDRFAAKTSRDIRDTLTMKRRKGEFIGAFAPYGYQKDQKNKNRLILEEEAAKTVRDIFHWFVLEGRSKAGIAKQLNEQGILNPAAYKRSRGLKYCNPQIHKNDGLWSASSVSAILKNQMYTGTMVQGRQRVISYKVHDKIAVPKEEWFLVENTHAPAVDKEIFERAQLLQSRDTRTPPGKRELHLFAGFLYCADCGKVMTRQRTGDHVYYYCRTYREKSKKLCSKHTVREEEVKQAVLVALQQQIAMVSSISQVMEDIKKAPAAVNHTASLAASIKKSEKEMETVNRIKDALYADWKQGDISREEYHRLKNKYEEQAVQSQRVIQGMKEQYITLEQEGNVCAPDLTAFLEDGTIQRLDRSVLADFVEAIYIHENREIEIAFSFPQQVPENPLV